MRHGRRRDRPEAAVTGSNLRFLGEVSPGLLASLLWPADEVASRVLAAITADERLLGGFLAASRLGPRELLSGPRTPEFLLGVLDHATADEATLVAVAAAVGCPPSVLVRARAALAPRPEPDAAEAPRPLMLFCKGCGATRRVERAAMPEVPATVVMIETARCEACGTDAGAVTWLDARGREVARGDA